MCNENKLKDAIKKYKDCFENFSDLEIMNIIGNEGNYIVATPDYKDGKPLLLITEKCYNELQEKFSVFNKSFREIEDIEKEILSYL